MLYLISIKKNKVIYIFYIKKLNKSNFEKLLNFFFVPNISIDLGHPQYFRFHFTYSPS